MNDATARENERLGVLHALELLDTASCEDFDQITRLAAFCFDVPTVLISLVDRDRQQFLSRFGFSPAQTSLDLSICAHAIKQTSLLEVSDLTRDPRFFDHPVVVQAPYLQFYAGAPLVTHSGHVLGTICLIDYRPRSLTDIEREQLKALANMVMNQIALRQSVGRRSAVSGLSNRHQFVSHIKSLPALFEGEYRLLVLIDVFDTSGTLEMAQALGMAPIESLVRTVSRRLQTYLKGQAELYHIAITQLAFVMPSDVDFDHEPFMQALMGFLTQALHAEGMPIRPALHAGLVRQQLRERDMDDALRKMIASVNNSLLDNRPWTYYDAERDATFRRGYRLASDIQRALDADEFYLKYQPRVDLENYAVVSVEALIRWKHPELGEIMPGEFIPIVERTTMMQAVTLWVVNAAFAQMGRWKASCPGLRISINLSARDFDNERLLPAILAACERHAVAPGQLEVEVTEGEWLRNGRTVMQQLLDIRAAGIDVAIDDFGAGYSNFAYLKQIPANVIKLDQSLILDLPDNRRHQTIARAILDLARNLGYRTVAEGVESRETLALLQQWGCDQAQGYFISRPVDAADIAGFVDRFGT